MILIVLKENVMKNNNIIKIISAVFVVLLGHFMLLESILLYGLLRNVHAGVLIAIAAIMYILALIIAFRPDYAAGCYACEKCGHRFKPKFKAYFFSVHTVMKRWLKCPECGERSFCKRNIETEK